MPDRTFSALTELLERQRDFLDRALGKGSYEVQSDHVDHVSITTTHLKVGLGLERDGEIEALVALRKSPTGAATVAVTSLWAKFLKVEAPLEYRDENGRSLTSTEDQLRAALDVVVHLQNQILADQHTSRDAAFYIEGYTLAYNEWATGNS